MDDKFSLGLNEAKEESAACTSEVFGVEVCGSFFLTGPPDVPYDAGKLTEHGLPVDGIF
jgi:hypothetical protein